MGRYAFQVEDRGVALYEHHAEDGSPDMKQIHQCLLRVSMVQEDFPQAAEEARKHLVGHIREVFFDRKADPDSHIVEVFFPPNAALPLVVHDDGHRLMLYSILDLDNPVYTHDLVAKT